MPVSAMGRQPRFATEIKNVNSPPNRSRPATTKVRLGDD